VTDNVIKLTVRSGTEGHIAVAAFQSDQAISRTVGDTLLERMQETQGMPYHPPTLQFKASVRGSYIDYEPANPLARDFCDFAGRKTATDDHLDKLRGMGFAVEVRA
jgi:hypothetical protein